MAAGVMLESEVPGLSPKRGKVRDNYDLGDGYVALVATDRVSAFDQVMKTGIPKKGEILVALTLFWLKQLQAAKANHFVSSDVFALADQRFHQPELAGRTMICKKARKVVPFECIVRGYLTGSAWESYQATGSVCGIQLPKGLKEWDCLPSPIFTPSTKEEFGHDKNVSFDFVVGTIGIKWAEILRSRSLAIFNEATRLASGRELIIVDTKFEFGVDDEGKAMLIDEVLTPDSSRYIPKRDWEARAVAKPQSYDKQYLRDWLQEQIEHGLWDKNHPGIKLPDDVVMETAWRYAHLYEMLTGAKAPLN